MDVDALQAAFAFLDSWLDYRARQVDIPGFCISILKDREIMFSRAYGYANVERQEMMTTSHIFSMASQSKMFTATAMLKLVDQGSIRFDDEVSKYLPWLAKHKDTRFRGITTRQLLGHGAGLIRDGLNTDYWEFKKPFPTAEALQEAILETDITVEPNTQLKYSNLGYALLGQLIEAVSGRPYADFISENIIQPLELAATWADFMPSLSHYVATGYGITYEHRRAPLGPRKATGALVAAAGIHSTTDDMCRFAATHFFRNEDLIRDNLKREAQRSQWEARRGYYSGMQFGLGFEKKAIGNRTVVGHSGHLAGHLTATYFDPHERLAIAVAANCKDAPSMQIVHGIFETLDWFASAMPKPTPKSVARYSTRLFSETSVVEVVAARNGIVAIDPDDWQPFAWFEELQRVNKNTLRITTPGSMFSEGELLHYTFSDDVVQAVRYAGFTMIPGPIGRRPEDLKTRVGADSERLTLDGLGHMTLRVGHVMRIEPCRGALPYRLLIDFGPEFGAVYSYITSLPPGNNLKSLQGQAVLGATFRVWRHESNTSEAIVLGVALDTSPGASHLVGDLVALVPDSVYPRTLWASAANSIFTRYSQELRQGCFKLQAMPVRTVSDVDNIPPNLEYALSSWLQGRYRKAIALLDKQREDPPYWLLGRKRHTRIIIDDGTEFSKWDVEFARHVGVPLGEACYLLPRHCLAGVDLPEGDFTIWDNKRVTVSGYDHGHWTHTTAHDTAEGNDIRGFLELKKSLLQLALTKGQRLAS